MAKEGKEKINDYENKKTDHPIDSGIKSKDINTVTKGFTNEADISNTRQSENTNLERFDLDKIKLESSFADTLILDNENLDARSSIDFGGQKYTQDFYPNMTHQSDANSYKKRMDSLPSNYDPSSKSLYNPSMSSMRFLSEIDLRCDDHLAKLKEDFKADRFCSECKVMCCDSCVIEYHSEHIKSARLKVEDYFKKQKIDIEELRFKINSSIKHKTIFSEFDVTMDFLEKNISTLFLKRKNVIENLKIKLEMMLCEENVLFGKMKESLFNFYKDEALKRMDKPIKELEIFQNRLQIFLREWDGFSSTDKANALKNNQISKFMEGANELNLMIESSVNVFRSKSKIVEKKTNEILNSFQLNEKLIKIESEINEISELIKSSVLQVDKIKFDEICLDEVDKLCEIKDEIKLTGIVKASEQGTSLKKNDSDGH